MGDDDTDRIFPRSASLPHSLTTTHPISPSPVHFPQNFPSSQIFQSSPPFTHLRLSTAAENPTPIYFNPPILASQKQKPKVERETFPSYQPLLQSLVRQEKTEAQTLSTCLLAAVISGNTRIVYQLLAFGVSVNLGIISPYRYY